MSKEIMNMNMTAVVENKPQLLKPLRPFMSMVSSVPTDLSPNASYTLEGLFACFTKQGHVKEGIADDILFGFGASEYDLRRVVFGLVDLKRAGYIFFQDDEGNIVDENSDNLKKCWVRYTDKLLSLVYSG